LTAAELLLAVLVEDDSLTERELTEEEVEEELVEGDTPGRAPFKLTSGPPELLLLLAA